MPSSLQKFKLRYNVAWKKQHGEKQSADVDAADSWAEEKLPKLIENYEEDNIFNADESGLYWRGLPDKGYYANSNNNKHPSGAKIPKKELRH